MRAATSKIAPAPSLEVLARSRLLPVLTVLGLLHAILAVGYMIDPLRGTLDFPLSVLRAEPWSVAPAFWVAFATPFSCSPSGSSFHACRCAGPTR